MRSELRFHPGKGSKWKIITSFKTKSKCWERGEMEPGSQVLQQWRKEDNCLGGRRPPPSKGGAPPRREGEGGAPRGGEEPRRPQAVSLLSPSPQTTQVPPAPRTPSLWAHEDGGSVALPGCPSEPHPLIPDPGEAPFFQNAVFSRPRAETKVKTNQMIVFWVPSCSEMANAALAGSQ